jgi:hypothetical protein
MKTKRQYMKDIKRLENAELDMEALQRLVNQVRVGEVEVSITVNLANGNSIKIERKKEKSFKTFAERFAESRGKI